MQENLIMKLSCGFIVAMINLGANPSATSDDFTRSVWGPYFPTWNYKTDQAIAADALAPLAPPHREPRYLLGKKDGSFLTYHIYI